MNRLTRLRWIWRWLTEPSTPVREHDQERQARLLSALFLVFMPLGFLIAAMPKLIFDGGQGILQDSDVQVMLVVFVVGLIVYRLSRTRHYILSAVTVVCITSLAIFAAAMPEESQSDYVGFYYLVIPILLNFA